MNPREKALYDQIRDELDVLYRDVDAIRAEFKDLISDMAAQIMAEAA